MNRSFYLLLVFGFSMAVSGGLETLRTLRLAEQPLSPYLLVTSGLGALLFLLASAALHFPGNELHNIYRRQLTAHPAGAFLLGAVFGLGVGIPRIKLDDLTADALFTLHFALILGICAALWVALRQRVQDGQKKE